MDVVENPGPVIGEVLLPLLKNDLPGTVDAITGIANRLLPGAERSDYMGLISWLVRNSIPDDTSKLLPWAMNALEPAPTKTDLDNTFSYFLDYLFGKKFSKVHRERHRRCRSISELFGDLEDYWKENNTGFFTMDLRAGVQVTKQVSLQFMINNLLNNQYSIRPMDVSAPCTFVMKANIKF